MRRYEAHVGNHIRGWQKTIDHAYADRLLALFRVREVAKETAPGKMLSFHFEKHLPRVLMGEAPTGRYSVGLIDFMCKHALLDDDPELLAIR